MNKPLIYQRVSTIVLPSQKIQLALIATLVLALIALQPSQLNAAESAPQDSGSDPRILPDLEQERLQALADSHLPDTQILWLETQHESFLGLFQPANAPTPKGAALLLHHDRTSADWPGTITTLRHGLPDQGWHTLSLSLPDEPEYIPPRIVDIQLSGRDDASTATASSSSATPNVSGNDNEDKLKQHFEQISARIEAGLTYLQQQQPKAMLILGEGTGGYWALRFTIDQQGRRNLYPVLIDTVPPITPTEPLLIELIDQLLRPTLDLYHGNGLKTQPIEILALQRRNAAKRQGHQLLTSARMSPRAGDWRQPDKRLLGVVQGMLKKQIAKATAAMEPSSAATKKQTPPR